MKTNDKYPSIIIKNCIGIILIAIVCAISYRYLLESNYKVNEVSVLINTDQRDISKKEIIDSFIESNDILLQFYSETFQIKKDELINQIKENNKTTQEFNELDIFNTKTVFKTKDESILEYLLTLEKSNPKLFSNKKTACQKDKKYILGLIDYFTSIYDSVDPALAKSIALIESGYSSKYMLNKNNIFGGMSNKGLITYKNINYGVLKYIKLLNDQYYAKGLTTVEDIGRKYNPIKSSSGKKVANPTWVSNVSKNMFKYSLKQVENLEQLLSI